MFDECGYLCLVLFALLWTGCIVFGLAGLVWLPVSACYYGFGYLIYGIACVFC